jgi:hypothetical protein
MDLELATTRDILEELRKRGMRFVFVGMTTRNGRTGELYFGCQGSSAREAHAMLRLLERRLTQREGQE